MEETRSENLERVIIDIDCNPDFFGANRKKIKVF